MTTTLVTLTPTSNGSSLLTSPLIPELLTEGYGDRDTIEHLKNALDLVLRVYENRGKRILSPLEYGQNDHVLQKSSLENAKLRPLIELRHLGDDVFRVFSNEIPELLTEGKGINDCLRMLTAALALLLEVDSKSRRLFKS